MSNENKDARKSPYKVISILFAIACIVICVAAITLSLRKADNNIATQYKSYIEAINTQFKANAMYEINGAVFTDNILLDNNADHRIIPMALENGDIIYMSKDNVVIWLDEIPEEYIVDTNWLDIDPNQESVTAYIDMPDGTIVTGNVTSLAKPYGPSYEYVSRNNRFSTKSKHHWTLVIDGKLYLAPNSRVTLVVVSLNNTNTESEGLNDAS